ncbi:MAG: glycosyltransferase family 4 protein [Sulfitobacter sp.]
MTSENVRELYKDGNTSRKIALTLGGLAGRVGDIGRATRHDIVFILREAFALGPPAIEYALAQFGGKMVFDFDDAIYLPSLAYDNKIDRLRDWGKPAKVIAKSNTVIAGSQYLADFANKTAKGRVEVLPTVVDHQVYAPRVPDFSGDGLTIGWIGTPRGSHYVADLMPVFQSLHQKTPSLRFVFIGCAPFDPQGLPIEFRDWSLAREPQDIAEFDIGIMPLTDDEETRGKCGFKLIQYMSSGVTAVGSPVGANNEIIEDGISGLFADGLKGWEHSLSQVITNHDLRAKLARNGRTRAIAKYSLQYTAPKMLKILQNTLSSP